MNIKKIGAPFAILTASALALSACASNNAQPANTAGGSTAGTQSGAGALSGTLSGAGASSQEAAMTAWINGFRSVEQGVTVQYNPVGSGSGREQFLNGQVGFAGSDSALKKDEYEKSKAVCGPEGAVQVPGYVNAISIAYNLKEVTESVQMDAETVAKVMKGEIKKWNDPAIQDQQKSGVTMPDKAITVVHRSDDSGTTKNFTEYLNKAAGSVWTDGAAEKWPVQGQESAQGTQGVVSLIQSTDGAIGYADMSAVGQLGHVAVKVGDAYVAPSTDAAAKMVEASEKVGGGAPNDMAVKIDRATTAAGSYPVVLISYHIYCTQYKDATMGNAAKAFGKYMVSEQGQKTASSSAGNAPLSKSVSDEATKAIDAIKVG